MLSANTRIAASLCALLTSTIVFLASAYGQGTTLGYIYGRVNSGSGPVVGVTVTALHPDTSRRRTAVTDADGRYRFSALAVGRYAVYAALGGLQSSIVPAEVNVGEGTSVELLLENPRTVEEVVVVESVVLMAPGAVQGDLAFGTAGNRAHYGTGSAYASLGGASVAENVYYINGMNVTNFRNGLGASTIPFEFYDQFQIKTGGYSAEFGRSTGGVVNAVTKRGTNDWQFTLGGYFQPDSLRGDVPNVEHPSARIEYDSADGFDERDDFSTFASAAGPLVRDRFFAYGIYEFRETAIGRGGDNHILTYRGYFGTRLATTVMWGASEYDLTSGSPAGATCPVAIDSRSRGFRQIGCWTDFVKADADDERDVARVDIEWTAAEQHLIRFGMDRERNTSFDRLGYSGDGYFQYLTATPGDVLRNGGIVPEGVTEVTRYRQFSRGGNFDVVATAFYIEDEWTIAPLNATLRLGLRNERFDNRNVQGQSIVRITDQFAPRIGLSWDVGGNRNSKIFANYGRYHLPVGSVINIFLGSPWSSTEGWYLLDQPIDGDGSTVLGTRIGETTVFADGSSPDIRTLVDQDIEPMAQDEFILGYERIVSDYIVGITFTWRDLVQGIEDISIDQAIGEYGGFNYVLANPGRDLRTFHDLDGDGSLDELRLSAKELGFPSMKRRYKAVTLDLQRRWDGEFYARASYTWSHSYGNYEGTVRSDTGEDLAGATTQFDFTGLLDGADGDLPNDRRHQLKMWGGWEFAERWQTSAALHFASGRPRNAFGYHPSDPYARLHGPLSFYRQGELTPRGSVGTTADVYRLDLGLKYTNDALLGGTLIARLDVFNVLDLDAELEVDEWADRWGGRRISPTFGLPTRFQQPRTMRIGLRYEF